MAPLSREQEVEVAERWCNHQDPVAADQLIRANLRFVVTMALSYRHYGLPMGDMIAEGNFGLAYALTKFDPKRGTRFVTYATYWIRAYMVNHIIRSWSLVGAGSGPLRSKLFFRLRRESARADTLAGDRREALRMLGERMGESEEKVEQLAQRLEARDVSLDSAIFDDSGTTMLDRLPCEAPNQETTIGDAEEREQMHQSLYGAIDLLDPREKFIVQARMMADSDDMLSLAEIGRRLGVSRERARQLESRAKQKLRDHLTHWKHYQRAA